MSFCFIIFIIKMMLRKFNVITMLRNIGSCFDSYYHICGIFLILIFSSPAHAQPRYFETEISDQISVEIKQHPSTGQSVIVWIAPDFGFRDSHHKMAAILAESNLEVWMIDMNETLFLSRGSKAMREIDGKYIADLINSAATKTSKKVILMSGFYGAIPVLEGARYWQMNNIGKDYLQAAILFSPSLYLGVPKLGDDPQFLPIVKKTNIPIIIFQGAANASRWQVGNLVSRLHSAGSAAYLTLMPNIASLFYGDERSEDQQNYFISVPKRITQLTRILDPLPDKPVSDVTATTPVNVTSIDINLRPYQGTVKTSPIQLKDINNKAYDISSFKGKVTLLNFWATWCPPCVEEIPSLNHLQKLIDHPDFELISINYVEDTETVKAFTKNIKVEFPVLMDETGEVSRDWKILVLPSTYVIGLDGKIAYGVNAAIEWDSKQTVQQIKNLLPP